MLALGGAFVILAGTLGRNVEEHLQAAGFTDSASESERATALLREEESWCPRFDSGSRHAVGTPVVEVTRDDDVVQATAGVMAVPQSGAPRRAARAAWAGVRPSRVGQPRDVRAGEALDLHESSTALERRVR